MVIAGRKFSHPFYISYFTNSRLLTIIPRSQSWMARLFICDLFQLVGFLYKHLPDEAGSWKTVRSSTFDAAA
jgi:hypothetical protein